MKECPKCKLETADDSKSCICGHEFLDCSENTPYEEEVNKGLVSSRPINGTILGNGVGISIIASILFILLTFGGTKTHIPKTFIYIISPLLALTILTLIFYLFDKKNLVYIPLGLFITLFYALIFSSMEYSTSSGYGKIFRGIVFELFVPPIFIAFILSWAVITILGKGSARNLFKLLQDKLRRFKETNFMGD